MKEIGIYIHIPFCIKKCEYCDFVSYSDKKDIQEQYMKSLKKEIENWLKQNQDIEIETIYIGGGTPSSIDEKYIKEILETINPKKDISITIEVNPGTVTKNKLIQYKKSGINRLSIGLQSTENELLKLIGRIHTYEDFLKTYNMARDVGFYDINVDLMIGLPSQTINQLKNSLEKIVKLNPEHISVYSLILEQNTKITQMVKNGILKLPDEESERNMYWYVKNFLELNNYIHYEISNFAKMGFEAKHNVDCWKQKSYRGFGISACSYIENKRYGNISDINMYIKNIENKNYEKNIELQEIQSKKDKMNEYMLLGLRMLKGISISEFEQKFDENPIMIYKKSLNKLNNYGLIVIDGDIIRLSEKGLDLANVVWEEFI